MPNKKENLINKILDKFKDSFDRLYSWRNQYESEYDSLEGGVGSFWSHKEVDKILKTFEQTLQKELKKIADESYKDGYNKRLKDEGKIGERWQHLYL